jgi:hypothetical protein
VTDENTIPEKGKDIPTRPPKVFEQLGVGVFPAAAKAREPGPRENDRPELPKQKFKVSTLLWLPFVVLAVVLAFLFLGEPGKDRLNKLASGQTEVAPEASSSAPVLPVKPRVSAPMPTDEEIDAAPVLPMKPRVSAPMPTDEEIDAAPVLPMKPRVSAPMPTDENLKD